MNKYFFKEWIKLKCSLFYGAGWIAGFSVASFRFWIADYEEEMPEKQRAIERAKESLEEIIKYIDNDGHEKPMCSICGKRIDEEKVREAKVR